MFFFLKKIAVNGINEILELELEIKLWTQNLISSAHLKLPSMQRVISELPYAIGKLSDQALFVLFFSTGRFHFSNSALKETQNKAQ